MSSFSRVSDASERPEFESGTGFLLTRLGSLAARSRHPFLADRGLTQVQYATEPVAKVVIRASVKRAHDNSAAWPLMLEATAGK